MSDFPAIVAKKSWQDGHVTLNVALNCRSYLGDTCRITGSTKVTSDQARALAASLIDLANKADEKVTIKAAAEARRKKWRDQQVAAGRMIEMSAEEVFLGHR